MESTDNTATNTTDTEGGVAAQPATQEEAADTPKPDAEMSLEDYKQALANANKEAARYRVERNELRGDAQKYRELQEAEKTELQRTQEALETARNEAQQAQVELARAQALAKYGIAEDNADLLGSDPEKFEQNAQRLGQLQAQAAKRSAPPSDYPVEKLVPGASSPKETPDTAFPSSWPVTGPFAKK